MRIRLTRRPGQPGTKRLVAKYGASLVCVRYRYDAERKKRYKTIELIVEVADWPPLTPDTIVSIRVAWEEAYLRHDIKAAGGQWNPERKLWKLRYDHVVALGLVDRIVPDDL